MPALAVILGANVGSMLIVLVLLFNVTRIVSVRLIALLAGDGMISPDAAPAMVVGANLGLAVNPLIEGLREDPAARRMPVGNFVNCLIGCAATVAPIHPIGAKLSEIAADPAHRAATFHLVFNLALVLLFIGLLPWIARLLVWAFPDRAVAADLVAPLYLDPVALRLPRVAVANPTREACGCPVPLVGC